MQIYRSIYAHGIWVSKCAPQLLSARLHIILGPRAKINIHKPTTCNELILWTYRIRFEFDLPHGLLVPCAGDTFRLSTANIKNAMEYEMSPNQKNEQAENVK